MYDSKTQVYSYPLYFETEEAANKWFDLITNCHGCGLTHTNSSDFVIYHIGIYDNETGRTDYFEERKFFTSLGGMRRPCKACDEHKAKSEQLADNHYAKSKGKKA